MKILMTADTVGGVFTYAVELVRALNAHGVEVVLATQGRRLSEHQWRQLNALPNVLVEESEYRLEWMEDCWEDVCAAGQWLRDLGDRHHPDLLHFNDYAHAALGWAQPVLVTAHSCVYSWFHAVKKADPPPEIWSTYRARVSQGLRAADAVVAPTRAMLLALGCYHVAMPNTWVIPNARTAEYFPPGTKEERVLTAGRLWDEAKNIACLAGAAGGIDWPCYVAGESGEAANLEGLQPLGMLSQETLAREMARSSIYVHPARYEPFGLAPLEAALAGNALVLGDIGSLREVWGDAAVFVAPDDPQALSEAVNALARDNAFRSRMAWAARKRALSYAPAAQAEQYINVYQETMKAAEHRRTEAALTKEARPA